MATDVRPGGLAAYRAVLRLPGVTPLIVVGFLTRVPFAATTITITLHVVLTLQEGYAAAGLVGAASTVGMAVGAPLLGRLVDKRGLRPMLALSVCAVAVFWSVAPTLGYPALLGAAVLGGVLTVPVQSVVRQSLAAAVPVERRRQAFALDSMAVETSYIIGPAVGAVMALQLATPLPMWIVGGGLVCSGVALWLLNPPTRDASVPDPGHPPAVREWLSRRLVGALLATSAAVLMVFGVELSMIAALQTTAQSGWIPVVNAVWCVASLAGGFAYGAARRARPLPLLVACLGVATLPVALGGPWWSFAFLLVPAGLLTAPTLAASSERISGLAPERARGLVTGLHGSAITLGAAAGTPLAGFMIDQVSPGAAILTVGAAGICAAGLAWLLGRR